jgi:hypothetical protein
LHDTACYYPSLAVIAAEITKAILADITAGLFSQVVIAYAVPK